MMKTRPHILILALAAASLTFAASGPAQAAVSASYLYRLSDFSGPVQSLWARVAVDPQEGEVYTLDASHADARIFNETAMQVHVFGEEYGLASANDLVVVEGGEVYILFGRRSRDQLLYLDYRGALIETIDLKGLPPEFAKFQATFLDYRDGDLYLADAGSMQVAVFSRDGHFRRGIDIKARLLGEMKTGLWEEGLRESERERRRKELEALDQAALGGFSVDADERLYFTLPTLFSAYRMDLDGTFQAFGTSGGARGKFGVVAGIEADGQGNIYVADHLRSVVLVFDKDFTFLTEFGYRGAAEHNLLVPDDIAIDEHHGRLYVSQAANLGVSVFNLEFN
jgi:DNA-binding beta-propeller fold protein YncE